MSSPLISPEALVQHLSDPAWVIVDTRHDLADPGLGRRLHREARIPGARYLSIDDDLSAAPTGRNGRHPLPSVEAFAATLGRAGIGNGHTVVVYDQGSAMFVGRLWWMLRWVGHTAVWVLDGGFAAWQAVGLPTEAGEPIVPTPVSFTPSEQPALRVTAEELALRLAEPSLRVVDARAPERYRGDVEPLDAVAGHIPGAINRPFAMNLRNGRFKPAEELAAEWQAVLAGRDPEKLVHYCGSGVSALANMLAMEHAGLTGSRLYAGSWSEWSSDPARPVAKGA
ncbi:MAG: sulfurtransferase [Casimicrobiaceae bacterium]